MKTLAAPRRVLALDYNSVSSSWRREWQVSGKNLPQLKAVCVTAELTNLGSSMGTEMTEIKGHLSNLVQALTNMSTTLNQTQAAARAVQQLAAEARAQIQLQAQSPPPVPAAPMQVQAHDQGTAAQEQVDESPPAADVQMTPMEDSRRTFAPAPAPSGPRLRKMDVSPPIFDGLIDGIKLNSFIFQFESYFTQKGYSLVRDDHLLPQELNQCVRKNALIWYERYMTDYTTTKLWIIMKSEMTLEFREPNSQAKVRNQLLKLKQTGAYHGYVNKFRELQRVAGLDELTAINVFVNGLTSAQMRVAIQRKQPMALTAAVQEGFLEWELQDKPAPPGQNNNHQGGFSKKSDNGKQKGGNERSQTRGNNSSGNSRRTVTPTGSVYSHCGRGVHKVEDCWVLHPEKKPRDLQRKQQLHSRIYALLESLDFSDDPNQSSNTDGQSN